MIETLIAATDTLGVDVHLNAPAIRLKQEDGAVVGAYAEGPEGVILANAKAVILTSGGFSGDTEKVRELVAMTPPHADAPEPANVGDGMRMAFEMGRLGAGGLPCQPIRRRCARHRPLRRLRRPAVPMAQRAGHRYIWMTEPRA
ncbi:MAG: FAD-binding protein [Coriobacteriaceae bacterium]